MLTLDPPATAAPARPAFTARVLQRWAVSVRMHPRRFREIVPAPFLRPLHDQGPLLLSLGCIQVEDAAACGTALLCALRVACRDRDGAACTWIARRHTGAALAAAMAAAGLPQVDGGLQGRCTAERLELRADDGLVRVQVAPGHGPTPTLFADASAATAALSGAVRSYSPAPQPGRWTAVDLVRQGDPAPGEHCAGWEGWLRTPWGDCTIDGVYRLPAGAFAWTVRGGVDAEGNHA